MLPRIRMELDGVPAGDEVFAQMESLTVRQALSVPTQCELHFSDVTQQWLDRWTPALGVNIIVYAGSSKTALFHGKVSGFEHTLGPSRTRGFRIRAYDTTYALRKRQSVRTHVQLTVTELARELVADLGLSVTAAQNGPLWPKIVQWSQSDLQLLSDVAARAGLYYTLRDDVLHLVTLDGLEDVPPLRLGESLLEARVELNVDSACDSVRTLAWDPWTAQVHEGGATSARSGRQISASARAGDVDGTGERTIVDRTLQDPLQADALAQAELDRRTAAEVTLWGVAEGSSELQPGVRVNVEGIGQPLDGRYVLTDVTHSIDRERSYVCEINTSPPHPAPCAQTTSTTLGHVTKSDDPESIGRVRVSFPAYDGIESDWLEVLCVGAGKGKGLVALPDVGDAVLVIFPNGDPAQAVVLGGLYGEDGPPDDGVQGNEIKRYTFVTPGGQRLQLDDEEQTLRAHNSDGSEFELTPGKASLRIRNGSYIELSDSVLKLHADTGLEIEAPGKGIVIRASSIDFDRA